jgi:NAD(P)-dependent dehydrogenase (short-subunit alcohol dehydrogenase family)
MPQLTGKIALVTGAASGIGRACAEILAAHGATTILTDIQIPQGTTAAAEITAKNHHAIFLPHDVTSEEAWVSVITEIKTQFGRLDILVNNAGIGTGGPVTEITLETWRKLQSINVEGVFLGVKHALPLMRASGGGSIINMSSVAGIKGAANLSAYCATKGAVRLFTKAVALECAAAQDKVRVNSVHPGIIDTPIWDSITAAIGGIPGANRPDLETLTSIMTPLGFPGLPRDIADGVLYLASDASRYVTGLELIIDGGLILR